MKVLNWFFESWMAALVTGCITGVICFYVVFDDKVEFANTFIEGIKLCEVETQSQCTILVISTQNLKSLEEEQ